MFGAFIWKLMQLRNCSKSPKIFFHIIVSWGMPEGLGREGGASIYGSNLFPFIRFFKPCHCLRIILACITSPHLATTDSTRWRDFIKHRVMRNNLQTREKDHLSIEFCIQKIASYTKTYLIINFINNQTL